jgi:hypothetical protein
MKGIFKWYSKLKCLYLRSGNVLGKHKGLGECGLRFAGINEVSFYVLIEKKTRSNWVLPHYLSCKFMLSEENVVLSRQDILYF